MNVAIKLMMHMNVICMGILCVVFVDLHATCNRQIEMDAFRQRELHEGHPMDPVVLHQGFQDAPAIVATIQDQEWYDDEEYERKVHAQIYNGIKALYVTGGLSLVSLLAIIGAYLGMC